MDDVTFSHESDLICIVFLFLPVLYCLVELLCRPYVLADDPHFSSPIRMFLKRYPWG